MNQVKVRNNVFIPMPVSIVGSIVNQKPNFMAVGWVTRANATPPMIAVGMGRQHYTNSGIVEKNEFSVCFPSEDLVKKTDYVGLVSGKDVDKSTVFTVFYGEQTGAPLIEECPLNLECKLVQTVTLPTNQLFIGEIVGVYAKGKYVKGNLHEIKDMNLFLLTMPDNTYWSFGAPIGQAWKIGKDLKSTK